MSFLVRVVAVVPPIFLAEAAEVVVPVAVTTALAAVRRAVRPRAADQKGFLAVPQKPLYLMKNSIVYIKYLDSVVYGDGEFPEGHDYKLVIFDAVGFLIREDQEAIYLSREVNTTHGNKRRAVIGIPKVVILERKDMISDKSVE